MDIKEIAIIFPIALNLSIVKIVLLKIGKEKVNQIDEYPLIHLIILIVLNDLISELHYINNTFYKITKLTAIILIIITAIALIKLIIQNFLLLVKEKKKKLWWVINLLIIVLIISFTGAVLIFVICMIYPYVHIMLVVNIYVILKFIIKHFKTN